MGSRIGVDGVIAARGIETGAGRRERNCREAIRSEIVVMRWRPGSRER